MLKLRAPRVLGHCARAAHIALEVVLGAAVLVAVCLSILAWRLSQGPLDMAWLAHRLEAAANAEDRPTRLSIGTAALAWEGFHGGVDRPLDLRVTNVRATDPDGRVVASIPSAALSVSVGWLLLGRLVPRALEVTGANLHVLRTADGQVRLDLGSLVEPTDTAPAKGSATPFDDALQELANPPETDRSDSRWSRFSQLRRLLIQNAQLTVVDRQLGATWTAPTAHIDLRRGPEGGVEGNADADLALGDAHARVTIGLRLQPGGGGSQVRLAMTPVSPAALATAAPGLAPLAALAAPLTISAEAQLGRGLVFRAGALHVAMGAGAAHIDQTTIAVAGGQVELAATPTSIDLLSLHLALAPPAPNAAVTKLDASAHAALADGKIQATVKLALDQVAFADLPALWPRAVAHNPHDWVTENITAGTARNAALTIGLAGPADLSNFDVTSLSGQLTGQDMTVWWMKPVPPLVHANAVLTFDNPDALTITASNGQQQGTQVMLKGGSIHITGLSTHHQDMTLGLDLAGPVADTVTVLRHPRLHLFDKTPFDLRDPAGTMAGHVGITLPLDEHLTIEQVQIAATAHIADAHLTGVAAGRNLDNGQLDLNVTQDGLSVAGTAALATIPAKLNATLNFRNGPANEAVEKVSVSGHATDAQLKAAGLDTAGILVGPVDLAATYSQRRDGAAEVAVNADMAASTFGVSPLGWKKAPGTPATASARILISHDHITGIDRLRADGDGLLVRGSADFAGGQPNLLKLDQVTLGRTAATGTVRFATRPDQPIQITLSGPRLDLSPRLPSEADDKLPKPKRGPHPPPDDSKGPPWSASVKFDQVLLADGLPFGALAATAESDGRVISHARIDAPNPAVSVAIDTPAGGPRQLAIRAGDAGMLLRALGILRAVQGGKLAIDGHFDDTRPSHPLIASASMDDFRVRNAPTLGRLLQAMTLYGLVPLLQGPGLAFSEMVAPFRYENDTLTLDNARAFNSSLGLTAKGQVDFWANTMDLQGTIVPAYFFNSLLGNIPLVGRLFSPEKGGGLFAASYGVKGSLDDPSVGVNPLSALTPGFLRGVFGIFDGPASPTGPAFR